MKIELIITGDDSPVIDPSSPVLYENATMGIFNLTNLEPDNVVTYTVQVITEAMGSTITIGMIHTGSFTVSPTPPSSTTTTSTLTTSSGMCIVIREYEVSYPTYIFKIFREYCSINMYSM